MNTIIKCTDRLDLFLNDLGKFNHLLNHFNYSNYFKSKFNSAQCYHILIICYKIKIKKN
jgi:hypothetical protein